MTAEVAQFLTTLTIIAAGALVAVIILSVLPARRQTMWSVTAIGIACTGSVALGTEIASNLPGRIMATHLAAATLEQVGMRLPELAELSQADSMVRYELSSAFYSAFSERGESTEGRAVNAGHEMGLVIQRAWLRHRPEISDSAAARIVSLQRQMVEELARTAPQLQSCWPGQADQVEFVPPAVHELQLLTLRTKISALSSREAGLPALDPAQREQFERALLEGAAAMMEVGDSRMSARCRSQLAFYRALDGQPDGMKGQWMRSRQLFLPLG